MISIGEGVDEILALVIWHVEAIRRKTSERPYARALSRIEAPLEAVQAALDHSNLATTFVYLRQLEGSDDPWWPTLAAELGIQDGGEAASLAEERR